MKSPNTSALATSLPSGNSMSFPPTARRLLDPTSLRDMLRSVPDASSTTASVRTASPSAASINGGAAERVTALPLQTPAQATVAPLKQAEVPVAEAVLALSPKAPRQKLLECNKTTNAASRPAYPVFTTADDAPVRLSYSASTSTTPPARQQPASQGLGVSSRSPPHESSRARLSSPTREGAALPGIQLSSEAAAPAQVSTAARSPLSPSFSAYEPIHVEATTVPRAHGRCCTPPFLRLTSLSSVRQVHLQRLHGCCASLIPRIKYHSVSPLGRHTDASASRSRYPKRLFSSFTAGRSVSPHDNGNALGSSCSGSREQATFLSSARSSCHLGAAEAPAIPPLLAVMAKPHLFVKHPVRVSSRRVSSTGGVCADGVPTYVFVTIDEECVVAVSAARFQRCVETANLLEPHNVLGGGVGVQFDHSGTASLSIAVRSFKRAQQFFGKAHCKGMRVAEVKRVSRGNEEPLLLFNAEQRERFHDLSRIICIAAQTHAFILEAASSAEAKVYVRNWRKYLHSLRGHHIKRPHIGGVENNSASHSHRLGTRARVCNGSRNTFGWTFDGCASRYSS
ncbi:hypothetical protein JKF63_01365 [Porcisia hertigi]|uniref:Kinetoplastid PH-like domain-containing protein n=1 Tax=Porcisia hertigi TaxID=2761500 RepID=A0A836L393_9TRYP|nr:hypothetical protein JKF63_01365 [Porcisia hertigi]